MTEKQIQDGFDRLQGALAPPADVADRVQQEIGARRRRRRTALAGVGVLVVAGTAGGVALLGSGSEPDGSKVVASDTSDQQGGSFTLTRDDGSTVVLDDLTLSCDQPPGPGGEPGQPGHLYLYSPFTLSASGDELEEPFVYLDVVADRVDGKTFTLPFDSASGSSEDRGLVLFAADSGTTEDGPERANEVSSAEDGAAGEIRVLRATCDPTPVLEVEVDATLGSELTDRGAWQVEGSFRQD